MKELVFEELSLRQKLGMVFTGCMGDERCGDNEFVLKLIKERALGAVWLYAGNKDEDEVKTLINKVKEAADYPILIITDAEPGLGDYQIGKQSALGRAGTEKHAYAFGKATAVQARKLGYNVVCNPILDIGYENPRRISGDKDVVTKLAAAEIRGMHDGGVLCTAKHYPGSFVDTKVDTHMAESMSYETKEDLLNRGLYPYLKLMEQDLLDGIMTGHQRLAKIDPDHPTSLSKSVIDVIREQGFDGFAITDALCMMGVRAKFDDVTSKGLAVSAGNDLLLPEAMDAEESFNQLCEAYEKGMISDEVLNAAVKRVLNTQHKTTLLSKDSELTEEEKETVSNINIDCIYAKTDDGVPVNISRDGKHFFIVMVRNGTKLNTKGTVDVPAVDTFSVDWIYPWKVEEKIKKLFPNSGVRALDQFPSGVETYNMMTESLPYDDIVFLTFTEPFAYTCPEAFTYRIINIVNAMQVTNRISTIMHFGNPRVLEDFNAHIPRYIIGCQSEKCVDAALEVLAGNYPANGTLGTNVNLK